MYRLLTLLGLLTTITALSDVNQQCINNNSEDFSNDRLVGTWYLVYKFTLFGTLPDSQWCTEVNYTRPTTEELAEYRAKYSDPGLPYSLDDNPVLKNDSYWLGLVTGNKVAKFYVLEPSSTSLLSDGYTVYAYKPLSDRYIMYQDCAMRGHIIWLMSNYRYPPLDEMKAVISATPELNRLVGQRYCATY